MTPSESTPDSATVEQEFTERLQSLVEYAHAHDLDINRNWTCRTDADHPDWEIEVVRLADAHE